MEIQRKMRRFLSVLLALAMIFNLNMVNMLTEVNAAYNGYDIVLTKVGAYYEKNSKAVVYADYRNAGNTSRETEFKMYFYVDGKKVGEGNAKGEQGRVTASLAESFSGAHAITAIADVEDDNKSNNNRTSYRKIESVEPTTKAPEPTTKAPEPTTQKPTAAPTTQAPTTTKAPETTTKTQPQKTEAKVVAMGYPTEIEENQQIKITAVIRNTGNTNLPAGTPVEISVDGKKIATVNTTKEIHAGEYGGVETSWTAIFGGHTFTATLGDSSVEKKVNVGERKIKEASDTVQGGADLVVTDIGWFNETTGVKNGPINVGDKIRFISYTTNRGSVATASGSDHKHGLVFSFNGSTWNNGGTTYNDTFFGPLKPRETIEQWANGGQEPRTDGCWTAVSGDTTITAKSDDGQHVSEVNENNNTKDYKLTVPYRTNVRFNETVDAPDPVDYILNHDELGEISGLVAKAYKSSFKLSWQAAPGATGYNIYDASGRLVATTTTTDYTISGNFEVGNSYKYTVKAVQTILSDTKESNGLTAFAEPEEGADVKAYPVPAGFDASKDINMTVNGEAVGVFLTRVSQEHSYPGAGWKSDKQSNVAIFDYEGGDAEVKITVKRTDINKVDVKPKSDYITATTTRSGDSTVITMVLPDGKQGQYDLEINGSSNYKDTIFVFAQEVMNRPAGCKDENVVKAGEIRTGHIVVPDNETFYIEGGGTIEGYVHMGHNSKLLGRGVISQKTQPGWNYTNRNNPLSIGYEPAGYGTTGGPSFGRNNVTVNGITILDPVGWTLNVRNSHDVTIKDVNIIAASGNGDGITIQSSYDVNIEGCFVRSNDDSIVIKNYDEESLNSHNIKVSNCVIWTDIANSLEIGYETNMGGYKGNRIEAGLANYNPEIYNILFYDIDIIHNFHQCAMSIHNAQKVKIWHIGYKDIRVEHCVGNWFENGQGADSYNFGTTSNGDAWAHDVWYDNAGGKNEKNIDVNTFNSVKTPY